jgi:RHS repeat-associated protein
LPEVIQFSNGNQIKNKYTSDGRKLGTEYFTQLTAIQPLAEGTILNQVYQANVVDQTGTAYIGNFEYKTYWNVPLYITLKKVFHSEGYVDEFSNNQTYCGYVYFRKDHLGNNREVWRAGKPGGTAATTLQRTWYYPSGLPWNYTTGTGASVQAYKYNSKEFIEMHGFDSYDYSARMMYPAIGGRFMTVDPLAEKYYSISPYAYCLNNPVKYFDPDGRFVMSAVMQKAYPRLTENMQRIASEWSGKSEQFKNALIESSGLNEKQIKNMLTFGKGPELKVENLDTKSSQSNGRTFLIMTPDGKVNNIGNGKISLDDNVVNMLESAQTPIDNAAGNIMVESTVLHEITHVGNAQTTNTGNGNFNESGKNFEFRAFGKDISRSNVRSFAAEVTPQNINTKTPQIQVAPIQVPIKVQLP